MAALQHPSFSSFKVSQQHTVTDLSEAVYTDAATAVMLVLQLSPTAIVATTSRTALPQALHPVVAQPVAASSSSSSDHAATQHQAAISYYNTTRKLKTNHLTVFFLPPATASSSSSSLSPAAALHYVLFWVDCVGLWMKGRHACL